MFSYLSASTRVSLLTDRTGSLERRIQTFVSLPGDTGDGPETSRSTVDLGTEQRRVEEGSFSPLKGIRGVGVLVVDIPMVTKGRSRKTLGFTGVRA